MLLLEDQIAHQLPNIALSFAMTMFVFLYNKQKKSFNQLQANTQLLTNYVSSNT